MIILLKKYGVLVALSLVMLTFAWMASKKSYVPSYAKGGLNQNMIIVALELTPTYAGWERYLQDRIGLNGKIDAGLSKSDKIVCLRTQLYLDLAFITTYFLLLLILVWIIFPTGWRLTAGWMATGLIASFDLLENIFTYFILNGFDDTQPVADQISTYINWMFGASLSKWTLMMCLVLWLFHKVVRWKGWWFTVFKFGLIGTIFLFLIMPGWDLEQCIQVPSVTILIYFVLIIVILFVVVTTSSKRQ